MRGLHVITDETLQGRFTHGELAVLAARGGAAAVQYREKRPIPEEECTMTLAAIRESLNRYDAALIVNDRVAAARTVGARGVHLGRGDMPVEQARRELGAGAVIGVTANSLSEAREADRLPADYLGVGPVFGTRSKDRPAPALGLEELARIVGAVRLPVVAIGGIDGTNAAEVARTGVTGVAVLSAVVCAEDPEAATRRIVEMLARAATR